MFSAFYCYFFLPKRWQKWTVFLSAIPFTIAGNVVRILMLVIGSMTLGSAFAIGTNDEPSWFHEACGFAVFIMVLGLECLFGSLLIAAGRRWSKVSTLTPARQPEASRPLSTSDIPAGDEIPIWRSGTILGLAVMVTVVLLVSPPVYLPSEAGVLMALPEQIKLTGRGRGKFSSAAKRVAQ